MLAEARRRLGPDVELVEASADALPFEDARFDALTFTYLLRYVDDPAATLREPRARRSPGRHDRSARVRRPAGRLARAVGALGSSRAPGGGRRDRERLARGRVVPRPVDSRLLRPVAARAPRRGVARSRESATSPCPKAQRRRRDRDVGPQGVTQEVRPAYYALDRGGWRDYVTLLHPPYTAWHLSYVAIGAALAPRLPPRPDAVGARGVRARARRRRARARRAAGPPAADAYSRRRALWTLAVDVARRRGGDRRRRGARVGRRGCSSSSRPARSSSRPTTSSSSAVASTRTAGSRWPGARSPR